MASEICSTDIQDELTLRIWDSDDSVKGDLVKSCFGRLEATIGKAFPTLSAADIEDVVAEAIRRFWLWREKFDPEKSKLYTTLYRFARQVAMEYRTGHLKWQKVRLKEIGVEAEFFEDVEALVDLPTPPDDHDSRPTPVQLALVDCFSKLPELQKAILQRFAEANRDALDATTAGKELGQIYKGGVPIPAGTIRVNKSRAWEALDKCMKQKGFDLTAMGYTND